MTTTLSEGVKVPDVGSVNWAGDLEVNWNLLNGALANLSGNVKLNRDNIWTGEQSFTLPIVGSITGTASKAIADEDGTSIKTGYGKLAGNQTWTGENTTTSNFNIQKSSPVLRIRNTDVVIASDGQQSLSESKVSTLAFKSSNNTFANAELINYANASFNRFRFVSRWYTSNSALAGNGVGFDLYTDSTTKGILPTENSRFTLGSSSYQWSSVYAQTYYYNGTAWGLDKANTWTTDNKFSGSNLSLQNGLKEIGSSSSAGHYTIRFKDKNNADMGYITHQTTFLRFSLLNKFTNGAYDPNGTQVENSFSLYVKPDGTKSANILSNFIPGTTNLYNLGTSTNKWKTLNGINPGALSLPDYDSTAKIDISGSITPDQYNNIYYTPPINGWLYVCFDVSSATTSDTIFYIQAKDNNVANSSFVQTSWMLASVNPVNLAIFFPVVANKQFIMQINFSNYTIIKAHVIPCLGNV